MKQDEFQTQSFLGFLKEKLKGHSFGKLLYSEIESFSFWLFKNFPGVIGYMARYFMLRLLAKSKNGMVWIDSEVNIVHANKINFGSNIGINSGSYINGIGGLDLGDYVLIGSNVTISAGRHPIDGISPPIFSRPSEPMKIIIEDDVWIGAGAVIMPGITLSKGTVVGANSVVTKSTESYAVMVGAPARKVKSRDNSIER